MRINRDLILGEITEKYAGTAYSSAKVALAYDCIFYAEEWFNNPTGHAAISGESPRKIRKDLKRYVTKRVRLARYKEKYGIIPSFIWWFVAKAVINWIINRIIDEYL